MNHVIIHVSEQPYDKTIYQYTKTALGRGAHYVVGKEGQITQLVRERDYTFHTENVLVDHQSIAIEHEGAIDGSLEFTDELYRASASLVRSICSRHGIPMDRKHVIGHNEVPNTTAADPGLYWDWDRYMALIHQNRDIIIDNATPFRFWAGGLWRTSSWNPEHYGRDYKVLDPGVSNSVAWYRVAIPHTGIYDVYIWFPSGPKYSRSVAVTLHTADGPYTTRVDQRSGGGRWLPLGTFVFAQGDYWAITLRPEPANQGLAVADAFKFVPRDHLDARRP